MKASLLISTALIVASLSLPAYAQQQGGSMVMSMQGCPMGGGMMMGHGMQGQGMMGQAMKSGDMMGQDGMTGQGGMMIPGQFVAGRIGFLEAELAMTEEQTVLFAPVAEAMRAHDSDMQSMHGQMMTGDAVAMTTLPERLELMEQAMTAHLRSISALREAVTPFYESLDETQRKTLDSFMCMM